MYDLRLFENLLGDKKYLRTSFTVSKQTQLSARFSVFLKILSLPLQSSGLRNDNLFQHFCPFLAMDSRFFGAWIQRMDLGIDMDSSNINDSMGQRHGEESIVESRQENENLTLAVEPASTTDNNSNSIDGNSNSIEPSTKHLIIAAINCLKAQKEATTLASIFTWINGKVNQDRAQQEVVEELEGLVTANKIIRKYNMTDSLNPFYEVVKKCKPHERPQRLILEAVFQLSRYPTLEKREELANETGLTLEQVKNWFQNRRVKAKKIAISGENARRTPKKVFSDIEKIYLGKVFKESPYPSREQKIDLADSLNVSYTQIEGWFKGRRQKSEIAKYQRRNFSAVELEILENESRINPYPTIPRRRELALSLNRREETIEGWFVRKRKEEAEMFDSMLEPQVNIITQNGAPYEPPNTRQNFPWLGQHHQEDDNAEEHHQQQLDDNGLLRQPQVLEEQGKNDEFECKKSTTKGH